MPIIIDEITRQRILIDDFTTDIIYDKKSTSPALQDESVPIIGPWRDHTGSRFGITSRNVLGNPSSANQLQGTDAAIMGEKLPNLNIVGQNTVRFRRRRARVHVDLGEGKSHIAKNTQ